MLIALTAVVSVAIGLGAFWRAAMQNSRATPDEPFRIAGNLYYVGTAGVTSFLLTDPMGDVLIDGGYPETAPTIMASLAKIGVEIHDVKVLLNTHAHFDHAGGLRALQDASGAELWISDPSLIRRATATTSTMPNGHSVTCSPSSSVAIRSASVGRGPSAPGRRTSVTSSC
jgi:glyoxylase-like metal-dependent hydrolase (beta-lactamase superfamily II)